ncbi:MAG TPA: hypothetical protein VMS43_14040 [Allosphingosinicella sp.]|nr:hypothetical protein [Allosphingosinicella sp.]
MSGPETRLVTEAELTGWARMALPGDSFVYCTGPAVPPGPTKERVKRLIASGTVRAHQRRGAGGALESYVVKRVEEPVRIEAAPLDQALEDIFEVLSRAAQRGRRCPSDAELARGAGLATRNQAAWRMRKLERSGRIQSQSIDTPDGPWRIVTIVQTRRQTASPSRVAA